MLLTILYYVLTAFGVGLVIFVHELGHFLAARAVGIRVEAFSIGFGKRLWGFRRGPTDYRICVIPLGGYVKMAGEDPTRPGTAPDEFGSKKIWQRVLVISAGVIMNMIFAIVAIPIAFSVGVTFDAPLVGYVESGSAAWEAGLRRGDRVISIDGRPILEFGDITQDVALASGPVNMEIERDSRRTTVPIEARKDEELGLPVIGIGAQFKEVRIREDALDPDGKNDAERRLIEAMRSAGLAPGDRIVALNGLPYPISWTEEFDRLASDPKPLRLTVERDGQPRIVELPAIPEPLEADDAWQIGVRSFHDKIGKVRSGGPADRMGLKPDDIIRSVNGTPVGPQSRLDDLLSEGQSPYRTVAADASKPYADPVVRFVVDRNGSEVLLSLPLPDPESRREFLESLYVVNSTLRIEVVPGSPAERAGIRSGDVIEAVDGNPVGKWADFAKAVRSSKGKELKVRVRRGDAAVELSVTPERSLTIAFPAIKVERHSFTLKLPVVESFDAGLAYTWRMVRRVVQTLRSIVSGSVSSKHLGGVITIFQVSVIYTKIGFMRGLLFLAMVSINLAILNILPIPVLDGGWLLFLIIEKIKGSPLSERTMGYFQWTGLALVLALMVYVTWNDVARIFGWM